MIDGTKFLSYQTGQKSSLIKDGLKQLHFSFQNMSLGAASVWSASNPTPSNWANDGAWGALKQTSMMNKSNNSNSLGFWDDAIISTSAPVPQNNKKQSNKQG